MKFLVVDDHPVTREGLKLALSAQNHTCFTAGTIQEAVKAATQERPDILILDHELPDGSGYQLIHKFRELAFRPLIAVFTQSLQSEVLRQYQNLQVSAILHKSATFAELGKAILDIQQGQNYYSPVVAQVLTEVGDQGASLTKRELEIIREMVLGKSNKQIGLALDCSEETIKTHKSNIMRKLNLNNSVEVCVWAVKNKIV